MKVIILAGGQGVRLWPAVSKDNPKQFFPLLNGHSLFQSNIAKNLPFCDSFIIISNNEYRFIIEEQMKPFKGVNYSCILETQSVNTAAAVLLGCLDLPLTETVLVIPAHSFIDGKEYLNDLEAAGKIAKTRSIASFYANGECSGMYLFLVGTLMQRVCKSRPDTYEALQNAYALRETKGNSTTYPKEILSDLQKLTIEDLINEATEGDCIRLELASQFKNLSNLDDLSGYATQIAGHGDEANLVISNCKNTDVINFKGDFPVIAQGLKDCLIVVGETGVFIGKKGESESVRDILNENPAMMNNLKAGSKTYRSWGYHETLLENDCYRVRKMVIYPFHTIYSHIHKCRSESWSVLSGTAKVTISDNEFKASTGSVFRAEKQQSHQISNIESQNLVMIETATGDTVTEEDMVSIKSRDLTEFDFGIRADAPIKLLPAYKDYLWGGTALKERYNKGKGLELVAESWEMSAHPAGLSIVATGKHKGVAFNEYIKLIGKQAIGWKCHTFDKFPLMIKFLDTLLPSSVQVHPDDEYALSFEGDYGKNEIWYIADAKPGAYIYCGFKRDISRDELMECIESNQLTDLLNKIEVSTGESYFIPAGTIHSIGEGLIICEIQQSSNVTYRLYDYDRADKFGNKRQLHIDKAMRVLNYNAYYPEKYIQTITKTDGYTKKTIGECKYFECVYYNITSEINLELSEESFLSIVCLTGTVNVSLRGSNEAIVLNAGDCSFVPAKASLLNLVGKAQILTVRV